MSEPTQITETDDPDVILARLLTLACDDPRAFQLEALRLLIERHPLAARRMVEQATASRLATVTGPMA